VSTSRAQTPIAIIDRNNEGVWCIDVPQLGLGASGTTRERAVEALQRLLRDETLVGADIPQSVILIEELALESHPGDP
jgi:hypothetical protein